MTASPPERIRSAAEQVAAKIERAQTLDDVIDYAAVAIVVGWVLGRDVAVDPDVVAFLAANDL